LVLDTIGMRPGFKAQANMALLLRAKTPQNTPHPFL
jgi:hypothetical protein